MKSKNDWIGLKNNNLKILEIRDNNKALCLCICGKIKLINKYSVRFGSTKSCGCAKVGSFKQTQTALSRPPGDAGLDILYSNLIYNSKKREIEFSLTKEELKNVSIMPCFYCGRLPYKIAKINNKKWGKESTAKHGSFIYSPLDRIDSNKGYISRNVVACCKNCNWAKNDLSVEEFKNLIRSIYNHLSLNKL